MPEVKKNNKIKVQYTGTLDDGSIFDKSTDDKPLELVVGSGQLIPGFEQAVEGMKINEEKKITIKAENAYGNRNEKLLKAFPLNSLPENFKPEKGMVISLKDDYGRTMPATITSVSQSDITLDLNHPLAGRDLHFNIKVVSIE